MATKSAKNDYSHLEEQIKNQVSELRVHVDRLHEAEKKLIGAERDQTNVDRRLDEFDGKIDIQTGLLTEVDRKLSEISSTISGIEITIVHLMETIDSMWREVAELKTKQFDTHKKIWTYTGGLAVAMFVASLFVSDWFGKGQAQAQMTDLVEQNAEIIRQHEKLIAIVESRASANVGAEVPNPDKSGNRNSVGRDPSKPIRPIERTEFLESR